MCLCSFFDVVVWWVEFEVILMFLVIVEMVEWEGCIWYLGVIGVVVSFFDEVGFVERVCFESGDWVVVDMIM